MAIRNVVTRGYGGGASIAFVVTAGYGALDEAESDAGAVPARARKKGRRIIYPDGRQFYARDEEEYRGLVFEMLAEIAEARARDQWIEEPEDEPDDDTPILPGVLGRATQREVIDRALLMDQIKPSILSALLDEIQNREDEEAVIFIMGMVA